MLNDELPETYNGDWQQKKIGVRYEHFYENYEDARTNIYNKRQRVVAPSSDSLHHEVFAREPLHK